MEPIAAEKKPERIRHKRHSLLARFRIDRGIRRSLGVLRHDAFERFRAGVSGDLPRPGGSGVVLASCDDYYYHNFAITLLASVERQSVAQRLHLHLCAPSAGTLRHIEALALTLRNVELSWTSDNCNLAQKLPFRTIYYAAARFMIAPLVLEAADAPLLAIDVDGIAVRPIWTAYEAVRRDGDVALILRPEERKPTMKVLASAVGFDTTPLGLRFAADLGRSLAAVMGIRPRYHVDQIAMHYLLGVEPYRSELKVTAMPKSLWDHDFDADSAIWTAKGWSRKESGTFLEAKAAVDKSLPSSLRPAAR